MQAVAATMPRTRSDGIGADAEDVAMTPVQSTRGRGAPVAPIT
jgi:hypothetical protein